MENLSRSHHQNMVSTKSFYNDTANTLYDDVFGGPPRFGAPPRTLSPRVEDYNEIFGGFHAASRVSSIPVLDLPVVNEDQDEVFFDVRSSLGFDYSEVFGGFSNGPDFAVSHEELMMTEANGGRDGSSSGEAWTPVDAEYLSEESDNSAGNQCLSNGDSHESIDGSTEFNISYHKASQSTNEDMASGVPHVTQILDFSGYSFAVDKASLSPKTDDECPPLEVSNGSHLNIDFSGEMLMGRHPRKTVSHPANASTSGPLFGDDIRSPKGYVENGSFPNGTFVTISDLSLRTLPSQLPPPSRPPPALDVKTRVSGVSTPSCNGVASERKASEGSPPYFDVEVDASSSAAAIKEAMEKAQAKLKSAKELMNRKKDGFQSHVKLSSKNGRKGRDGKVTKIADGSARTEERKPGVGERDENRMEFSVSDEKLKLTKSTPLIPDSLEGRKQVIMAKMSTQENNGRESLSSQGSDEIDGVGEWKEAGQFFELVRTSEPRIAFDQVNNKNILVNNSNINEQGKKEKKATVEVSKQQLENVNSLKTVRADYELEGCPKKSKEAYEWEETNGRSVAAKAAHIQKRVEKKLQVAQEVFRREESEKKCRTNNHSVQREKKLTILDDSQKQENMLKVRETESKCEGNQTIKHKEKELQPKANRCLEDWRIFTCAGEGSEMGQKEAFESEANEEKLKAVLKQVHNERKPEEATEQGEKDRRIKEACEREENEKKLKETRQREEKEKMLREALGREENERRLKEALEKAENERRVKETLEKKENDSRLKETLEKEENERRQREAIEREQKVKREREACEREEKRLKDPFEKEENKGRLKEACERKVNEKRIKEALEKEENAKRIKDAHEQEKIEKKQKEAYEREECEKIRRDAFENEEIEKRIKEGTVTEDIGKKLKEACEQEENGKLTKSQEGEEIVIRLMEACEFDEIEATSQEETDLKFKSTDVSDKLGGLNKAREDSSALTQTSIVDGDKNLRETLLADKRERHKGILEVNEENADGDIETIRTDMRNSEKVAAVGTANVLIDEKAGVSNTDAQGSSDQENNQFPKKDAVEMPCALKSVKIEAGAVQGIGQNGIEKIKGGFQMESDAGNRGKNLAHGRDVRGKHIMQAQVGFIQEIDRDNFMSDRVMGESIDTGRKMDSVQPAALEVKGGNQRTTQQVNSSQSTEQKTKNRSDIHSLEEKETEKVRSEKQLEMERLRKEEEEREREREREKDRMAVDRTALEARERAYGESRERAECAAVERVTAEARQRAMNEARERLEKACAEAREKTLTDKPSIETRLRTERAAVVRAAAEARERAFEKTMAERAAFEARERIERSVSEKFSASSWNGGVRPSASTSDLQDLQPWGSKYPCSSAYNGPYYAERSEGFEGESAQRCKARLERHRRTAERAAKALAEKNMRDHLAQREQAERNRLAETLDADVKRWSSGKEGNLRALLSTLQYILGADSGWQPIPLTEVITSAAVKKAYRKATLCVHPDKLQQRGATIQQKYICEKVFDLLKEAWNKFNSEER